MQQIPSPAFIASKLDLKKREFVDEIMIFYVALTRAQNHLYIIGKGKKKDFSFYNLLGQNSYLKLIMFALGENFISLLFEQGRIDTTNRQFIAASDFEISEEKEKKLFSAENKFKEQLKKYDEFVYPNEANCKLSLKNSVTGILKEDEENVINLSQKVNSISDAILQGNAYHEALKLIDFDTVKCVEDIKSIVDLKDRMSEGYYELLDFDLLFKNIKIIKSVMANCQLFKEKEFIMQCNLNEIEDGGQGEDKFIVQGTVDLFGMGDKIILIDYKYSNASGEILLERYHKQLELYSLAIEKATGRKVDEKYILSLKEGKLINYQTERK